MGLVPSPPLPAPLSHHACLEWHQAPAGPSWFWWVSGRRTGARGDPWCPLLSTQFTLGVLCFLFSRPGASCTPDPSPLFLLLPLAPGGTPETGAKTRGFIKEASRASTGGARPARCLAASARLCRLRQVSDRLALRICFRAFLGGGEGRNGYQSGTVFVSIVFCTSHTREIYLNKRPWKPKAMPSPSLAGVPHFLDRRSSPRTTWK